MTKTTRLFLFLLDLFFLLASKKTSEQVMDVLTALRGPDNRDLYLKQDTTMRIRGRVFWRSGNRIYKKSGYGIIPKATSVCTKYGNPDHFLLHIEKAAGILGMRIYR